MNDEVGTITGRITNLEPEIQELKPRSRIKKYELENSGIDLSSLELRIMNWHSENEKRDVLKYQNELIREIEHLKSENSELLNRINALEEQQKTERAKILNEQYQIREKIYSRLLHCEDRDKIVNGIMTLVDQGIGSQRFEWTIAENQMALVPTSDLWSDELLNKIDDLFEPYCNGYRNYN